MDLQLQLEMDGVISYIHTCNSYEMELIVLFL